MDNKKYELSKINKANCSFEDSNSEYNIYRNYVGDVYEGTNTLFIGTKTKSGIVFIILNSLCILYYFIPLIWIIKYKNWYIFKQRNFTLTFIGGIANFICTFSNSATSILKMPCAVAYYSATVATFIMQICYIFRAFRLILLYKLNIFKVTILNQDKFMKKSEDGSLIEPNIYYRSLYRLVNKRIVKLLIPALVFLVTLISIGMHIKINYDNKDYRILCGFKLENINNRISGELYGQCVIEQFIANNTKPSLNDDYSKFNLMRPMFRIPEILTIIFISVCLIIAFIFAFTEINDNQKFGYKFDCLSSALISIIVSILYFYFLYEMTDIVPQHMDVESQNQGKDTSLAGKHQIYLRTKQGILFFVIVGIYIQFTSVIIPLIQCIYTEILNKKYKDDSINSMEYFYKVLNTPSMVEELKAIAVQEFSVENVLFWENYCLLQKLVKRVIHHFKEVGGESKGIEYYNLFTLQDIMYNGSHSHSGSLSLSSYENESLNPGFPLLPQLVPYFDSFYYTFIDIEGPAAVNITADIIERINNEFDTYPTIGIFDEAKDEVVESMFFTIYPIFLQLNRNQLGKLSRNSEIIS